MQPLKYLMTPDGVIWTIVCVIAGVALTWLSYLVINRIPAVWLCDYNETPSEELLSGRRVRYVGSGIVVSVLTAASLVLCRLQFNKGFDIYFIVFSLMIVLSMMIAVCDIKYTIIPDQFTIALAVLAAGISVYDLVRGFGILHTAWWSPLAGAAIGGGAMILIDIIGMIVYKKTGMGFGDVKLFAAVGLLTGFPGTLLAFAISLVTATVCFAVIMIAAHIIASKTPADTAEEPEVIKTAPQNAAIPDTAENTLQDPEDTNQFREEPVQESGDETAAETEAATGGGSYLAFGPYIAIAAICYIIFFDYIYQAVDWYLKLF